MTDVAIGSIAAPAPTPRRRKFKWSVVMDHAVLIAGSLFLTVPLFMLILSTTIEDAELASKGLHLAIDDQLAENLDKALFVGKGFSGELTGFLMMQNSFILGIGFAVGKIVVGMMAAYAIVYFRLRFATFAFWIIFTTLLLPLEVRILPSYEVIQGMGLVNTYTGLIVPLVASATATFFFRQFFRSVPEELVEAARIDGASNMRIYWQLMLPLSKPVIAITAIYTFMGTWNDFLGPLIYLNSPENHTLALALNAFRGQYGLSDAHLLMAASFVCMLPCVVLFFAAQRYFIEGVATSGMKG
ncbi:MAG: carbohydrate ABC transporter permease [Pseudomonadota bacterium]